MIKPICTVNELSHLCITPHGIWRSHHGLAACFLCKTRTTRTTRKRENAQQTRARSAFCVLLRLARCARSKRETSVWFSPFPRIFRFLLVYRIDFLVIVSHSVFDAESEGKIRFTLCLAVVEILHIELLSKLSKCSQCLLRQRLSIE